MVETQYSIVIENLATYSRLNFFRLVYLVVTTVSLINAGKTKGENMGS